MRKTKILYIGMSSNIGGIEKYLINIYRNIDKKLYDIKFLAFSGIEPCFYEEIKKDVIFITPRTENYFKFLKELKEIYINYKFDIIHINIVDFSCFERIIYAQKYSNAKIIIHSHIAKFKIPSIRTKIINHFGEKYVIKSDNGYIKTACSKLAGEYMFNKFKDKKFKVLNNGIDIEEFKFDKQMRGKIRNELGIENDCILLGNVGRMVYQKNQKYLIEILNELVKKGGNYKLLIIGKGPLKEDIVNLAKKYDVEDRLLILQDINNVYDYMSAMDIFVLPSNFEGLGIVLVEAQTSGLKCYTSANVVPEEVNILGDVEYIDLNERNKWIQKIEKAEYKDRNIDINKMKEYDIKNTVDELMRFYKKM